MDPHVQIFRAELEAVGCLLVDKVANNELEKWLFSPGSDHLQMLQWCLLQIKQDPQGCSRVATNESVFAHAKSLGLCKSNEEGVVIGTAPRKKQCLMWKKVLFLIKEAKELQGTPMDEIKQKREVACNLLHTLVRSKDFWGILRTKVNLMPLELHIPTITESFVELHDQLDSAEQKLKEATKTYEELSESMDQSSIPFDLDQQMKNFKIHHDKIEDSFKYLERNIFPLVKGIPLNTTSEEFRSIVDAVADKAIGLAKMLQDRQTINDIVDTILSEEENFIPPSNASELYHHISRCSSLLSDTICVLRQASLTDKSYSRLGNEIEET